MTSRRQWIILGALTVVYLIGLGVLAGVASERLRFDNVRTALVRQLDDATQRARGRAMSWKREVDGLAAPTTEVATRPAAWLVELDAMERAIVRRELGAADRAWRAARVAALRGRAWRPLIEVGDAALHLGAAAGDRRASAGAARELYIAALTRARAERSADGVLVVADAFRALGDHPVAEQCLLIAENLGAGRANAPEASSGSVDVEWTTR